MVLLLVKIDISEISKFYNLYSFQSAPILFLICIDCVYISTTMLLKYFIISYSTWSLHIMIYDFPCITHTLGAFHILIDTFVYINL